MVIRIIAVGPKHDPRLAAKLAEFEKRLAYPIDWLLLPYSKAEGQAARRAESASLLKKIDQRDLVVLLDETGIQLTSDALASKVSAWQASGHRLTFVIGGAYGVDQTIKDRADFVWSLSELVFPHQLVRLILVEQLYRVSAISSGHPYHHR